MSDDDFNMSMRKFLKTVGVTSQQQIEEAMRARRDAGALPSGPVRARVTLVIEELGVEHVVEGRIETPRADG